MPKIEKGYTKNKAVPEGPPCFGLIVAILAHIKAGIEGIEVFGIQFILGDAQRFAETLEMNNFGLIYPGSKFSEQLACRRNRATNVPAAESCRTKRQRETRWTMISRDISCGWRQLVQLRVKVAKFAAK